MGFARLDKIFSIGRQVFESRGEHCSADRKQPVIDPSGDVIRIS